MGPTGYEAGWPPRAGLDDVVKERFSAPVGTRSPDHVQNEYLYSSTRMSKGERKQRDKVRNE